MKLITSSRLEFILANRLVLNLREHGHVDGSSEITTKTDMFFREAYGQSRNRDHGPSMNETIMGNIGAPFYLVCMRNIECVRLQVKASPHLSYGLVV